MNEVTIQSVDCDTNSDYYRGARSTLRFEISGLTPAEAAEVLGDAKRAIKVRLGEIQIRKGRS